MVAFRYVALGDSYTIGTGVREPDRWPNQLVGRLAAQDPAAPGLGLVANLGVNGFTSGDVIAVELPRLGSIRPDFASLLIGVNDVVQGVPTAAYGLNVERILDALLARLAPNRIVTVGTPDFTVTPRGATFGDPQLQSNGIATNNRILQAFAEARRIVFVDVLDLSLRAGSDRALVAGDGLHPNGAQYALWVDRIEPAVRALLATA